MGHDFIPVSSVRDRPLPETLAESFASELQVASRAAMLEALRGWYQTGYTPCGVEQGDRRLRAAIDLGLAAQWGTMDQIGPYGSSLRSLYLQDECGFYLLPASLGMLLAGTMEEKCPTERVFEDLEAAAKGPHLTSLGTKIDGCNWYRPEV